MKQIRKFKKGLREFLRYRTKFAMHEIGLPIPFGKVFTKGEYLALLEQGILNLDDPEAITLRQEELDCYNSQPAPADQPFVRIQADDKMFGSERHPLYFQEYIGTDEEWVSPERHKAYEDWKATNSAVIEQEDRKSDPNVDYKELFDIIDEKLPEAISVPKELIFGKE